MNVVHVISGMQKAAGTTTFVKNIVRGLNENRHTASVVTEVASLNECMRSSVDIVHIHGLWSPLLHVASRMAKRANIPVVWSTHGMTAPWSMRHKLWKKLPAWWFYQKWDLKRAVLIHSTSDFEVEWNNKLGFKNCFVAPLGTTLSSEGQPNNLTTKKSNILKVLFVGRIYPVKGLVNLVRAAALIKQSNNPSNRTILFRIVGPNQADHQSELMKLANDLNVSDMLEWPGSKFGDELSTEYDNCDLLVLPSFTENFGGVVIDALAHCKPVVASKFTPWKILEDEKCGWWVDNDPASLASALSHAMDCGELCEMGHRGRDLIERNYTWQAVCDKMIAGYEEVLNGRT